MSKNSQLIESIDMIHKVLGTTTQTSSDEAPGIITVEMSAEQSKELQNAFVEKFGCTKQTAYYYYMYRGKKMLLDQGFKIVMAGRSATPKVRKTAKSETEAQIAKLINADLAASPFRI